MTAQRLLSLSTAQAAEFGRRPVVAKHTLNQTDLFDDGALIELIDRFPRSKLHALAMGTDPTRSDQNRLAVNEGVGGAELLRAVRKGRLWLNLTRVDRADARFRLLIDRLYAELAECVPGFAPVASQGNLLISSPHAQVYYHVDGPASVLWHVRGRKRIWVYPALDTRFVPRAALEDIFVGARHEYLPYDPAFDAAAVAYDLEPGQWTAWAHNAPHRVDNLEGVNVSLTTEHFTPQTRRRARVYAANRFLRLHAGHVDLSTRETGASAALKWALHRLARSLGLDPTAPKRHEPTLRVDPDADGGVVTLEARDGSARATA